MVLWEVIVEGIVLVAVEGLESKGLCREVEFGIMKRVGEKLFVVGDFSILEVLVLWDDIKDSSIGGVDLVWVWDSSSVFWMARLERCCCLRFSEDC